MRRELQGPPSCPSWDMARTALCPHISKNNIQVPDPGPVEQRSSGRIVLRPGKGWPPSGRLFKYLRVIFPRLAVFSGIQCSERYPALCGGVSYFSLTLGGHICPCQTVSSI
jgi:hypothetical protein